MDDIRAVLDAASSERAALFGGAEGGPMCALFAATFPKRCSALVLGNSYARRTWAPDYPCGLDEEAQQHILSAWIHRFARALHLVGPARPLPVRVGSVSSVPGGPHPDGALRVGMGPHRPPACAAPSPHVLTTPTSASRSRKTVDPGSDLEA